MHSAFLLHEFIFRQRWEVLPEERPAHCNELSRIGPGRYGRAVRVLRSPGFGALLLGQTVNATGNWVAVIAIWGFAAFQFDADAADIALLLAVLAVPGAVFGPLLGVPIDRLGPRRTLIIANALGFLDALALTQAGSYQMVIALALPLGLIEALAAASLDSLPPRLVDDADLVRANALLGGADDVALVIGPMLAAAVNLRWGIGGAFAVDAVTFLVGMGVAIGLKVPPPIVVGSGADGAAVDGGSVGARPTIESMWSDLREGLVIGRRNRGVRWTLAVAASTYLLWALFGVLEPLYVRDVLHQSDTVFALSQTVFGVGLVSAGLLIAFLGDRVARPAVVAVATVASGATAALYLAAIALAVVGVRFLGVAGGGLIAVVGFVALRTGRDLGDLVRSTNPEDGSAGAQQFD